MSESVRVIVRCRPLNKREKTLKCKTAIKVDESTNQIVLNQGEGGNQNAPKCFTFDGTYGDNSKTSTIYAESAASLVDSVLNGFNATVFAYGQTGCGKSFTMEGIDLDKDIEENDFAGIIPRACSDLFDSVALQNENDKDKQFLVHASYLEIYNENVRDLLDKSSSDAVKHLELKEHPDKGVYVKNLSMHRITTADSAQKLMSKGWKNRVTGETLMNQDSSRSHAIFTIHVETESEGNIRAGKLHLVDLAGSERQSKTMATGIRLKEAAKINLSLSALGNVISSLVDGKAKHIPYRDSKLTRILQDSLGGNTKTLMIACVSPADNNYEETLSTLRYANRAKKIKNAPRINEDPKDTLLRQYQEEITELKKILQSQLGTDGLKNLLQKDPLGLKNVPGNKTSTDVSESLTVVQQKDGISEEDSEELNEVKKQLELAKQAVQKEYEKRKKLEKLVKKLQKKVKSGGETLVPDNTSLSKNMSSDVITEDTITNQENETLDEENDQPKISSNSSSLMVSPRGQPTLNEFEQSAVNRAREIQLQNSNIESQTFLEAPLADVSQASNEHEKQLKRLLELQRGLTRSNQQLSAEALNSIKQKKTVLKSKQLAAEKRRELAKKAVAAQNDEEMFAALFEGVHQDVRIQSQKLDEAKEMIKEVHEEKREMIEGFEIERLELTESVNSRDRQNDLLEAIIDKIQPLIKRDCNYANIDRIKKQAVFNNETGSWDLPKLYLERDRNKLLKYDRDVSSETNLPQVPPSREGSRNKLSARQLQLLNGNNRSNTRNSPYQEHYSNDEQSEDSVDEEYAMSQKFRNMGRPAPGRLQPLSRPRRDY